MIQNQYMYTLAYFVLIYDNCLGIHNLAWKLFLFLPSALCVLLMNYIGVLSSSRQWEVGSGKQGLSSGK